MLQCSSVISAVIGPVTSEKGEVNGRASIFCWSALQIAVPKVQDLTVLFEILSLLVALEQDVSRKNLVLTRTIAIPDQQTRPTFLPIASHREIPATSVSQVTRPCMACSPWFHIRFAVFLRFFPIDADG